MAFNFDRIIRRLQIVLILLFWSLGLIWYAIKAERVPEADRNGVERAVVFVRDIPRNVEEWFTVTSSPTEHQEKVLDPDLDIRPIGKLQEYSNVPDELYLLHYRYEGDNKGNVYLQNIKTGEIAKTWHIPLKEVLHDLQELDRQLMTGFRNGSIPLNMTSRVAKNIPALQINAPIMAEDSSLLFNCLSLGHLYKLDKSSQLVWKSDDTVHHSVELDKDGSIWACSVNWGHPVAKANEYREDAVLCLDTSGKRSRFYSLSDIFAENDLFEKLVAATPSFQQDYGQDPYHLNDVVPARSDGSFWQKGDLFLSMRHKSLVLQYRPRDGTVVWYKQGPWLAQHDINIVGDSSISVFNNNAMLLPDRMSDAGSSITYFDFRDQATSSLGQGLFATQWQGRQTLIENGSILVEETNKGVYHLLNSTGDLICRFYIPYYANPSNAMNPNWGRVYLKCGDEFVLQ